MTGMGPEEPLRDLAIFLRRTAYVRLAETLRQERITAGVVHEHVAGVVALAPQTYGAPRGAAGAAPAAGGARDSRYTTPVHLRRADLRLGTGAETAGPVRGR
jgi:hypothetical protein